MTRCSFRLETLRIFSDYLPLVLRSDMVFFFPLHAGSGMFHSVALFFASLSYLPQSFLTMVFISPPIFARLEILPLAAVRSFFGRSLSFSHSCVRFLWRILAPRFRTAFTMLALLPSLLWAWFAIPPVDTFPNQRLPFSWLMQ